MSIINTIQNSAKASSPLASLLNKDCTAIGGIFRLNYSQAVVLTDDNRKQEAGGVPLGGFLVAAAGVQADEGFILDDEELILLRVRGTAPLPNENDLVQTRLAVVRDATTTGRTFNDVTDVLTRDELQQSAFDCEVIGTFFVDPKRPGVLAFGADIDNVVSSARYQVFLPSAEVLSWIASYPESNDQDTLRLGNVRFSSTTRRAHMSGIDGADVRVHITDFISKKTAVFGMTRTGKSNTIKTLVASICKYAAETGKPVGQLIFDPQGEYANVNDQDKTGLRLLGDTADQVVIYKMNPDASDPHEKPLRINFLNQQLIETVWALVQQSVLSGVSSSTNYLAGFRTVEMTAPDQSDPNYFGEMAKYARYKLALYALLGKAGVDGDISNGSSRGLMIKMKQSAIDELLTKGFGVTSNRTAELTVYTSHQAMKVFEWVQDNLDTKFGGDSKPALGSWADHAEFQDMAKGVTGGSGAIAAVKRIKPFHDQNAGDNVSEQIWDDMVAGRLAIVDLSRGNPQVAKAMSERIVNHLVNEANERFITGSSLVPFQIVVEEAHNLFEKGAKDVADNPWVRLSKEAAKYKIGLVYATQEVTSVDPRILSNTSNWLVAHLNSDKETAELSHYYDFKTWAESLRRCEDQGFVRMKTYSGKYIVPIQIAKFDHAMINEARDARGLLPVTPTTDQDD